jgi:DNA mismatch endonuclease, patch repair protein
MTDRVSKATRSAIMATVKSKNTGPELLVRSWLHRLGYRYRLHRRDLPGSPDLVFPGRKKAIFVHGCFWHGHDCRWGRLPKSRLKYWASKMRANRTRDAEKIASLNALGWGSLVVWQCELKRSESALRVILDFLGPRNPNI